MLELIGVLLLFIGVHSDLNSVVTYPSVKFISQQEMIRLYFGDNPLERTDQVAMYDDDTKTTYLLHGWDPENPEDQSRLLYGLVHHVQYSIPNYRERYQCPLQMEAETIRLVDAWRVQHELEPEAPKENIAAQAVLTLWEHCMGSHHH